MIYAAIFVSALILGIVIGLLVLWIGEEVSPREIGQFLKEEFLLFLRGAR